MEPVLSLGAMPPANAYLTRSELERPEQCYPLDLNHCIECGMVQLAHVVPAELLYRHYSFRTGSSKRMAEHFARLMSSVTDGLPAGSLVVEIGSNDGTALASAGGGLRMLGVDPATNIARIANARGVRTICDYWSESLAADVLRASGPATVIVAANVLGHVDDLDDFLRGVRRLLLLSPRGRFVFEVPYLGDLIRQTAYDTIYHEHLSYFALGPLRRLLARHRLEIRTVERFPVHGGTIRCTAAIGDGASDVADGEDWLFDPQTFGEFRQRVRRLRSETRERLERFRGKRIVGYGAPAKGTVLLNYCGIGAD
ncbi:MAG: methyltransferase domain-containing protein, partial [Planctomycetaceae bacterium]